MKRPGVSRGERRSTLVVVGALVAGWITSLSGAACAQHVRPDLWVTDGQVRATTVIGTTLYLGGIFHRVGPYSGVAVPVGAATGTPVAGFPRVHGYAVFAFAPDGSGGWFIGGLFDSVGTEARSNLAHVLSDLSVAAWAPNPNDGVRALALSGSTLYVGGDFSSIGGQPRNRIAAINVATGLATGWDPNAGGSEVSALGVSGSTVYVAGSFAGIAGANRHHLAAIDAVSGQATSWDPNPNVDPQALAVSGSTIYVGGFFTNVGGQPRQHIAAIDSATGLATSWDPSTIGNSVRALAVSGSTVYAGGDFSNIGGAPRSSIAALDATTGLATGWTPTSNGDVWALSVSGSTVYAGGEFTNIGGQLRNNVAALDAGSGLATAWNPSANNTVFALSPQGSTVFVGGTISSIGAQRRNNVAALDLTSGTLTSWDPLANSTVNALTARGSTIYAGGNFTSIGGQSRARIAALDAVSGNATAWGDFVVDGDVLAVAVGGSRVYAGGAFTTIGGQSRTAIAALDTATGAATAWNPGADGAVNAIAASGATVYAGGDFTHLGGQTRHRIAAVDTAGILASWNPDADSTVMALAASGATIYAGGSFTTIGGQGRNRIAALNATTGNATAWNPNADADVVALALSGTTVCAGGRFTSVGGAGRTNLAALDATTGTATTWNPSPDFEVLALTENGATVCVGGSFYKVGSTIRQGIAVIQAPLGILQIQPAYGGDGGAVRAVIRGAGFVSGATARLRRVAQSDIVGTQVVVAADGESLAATFDLGGKAQGDWDVVVTNPDLTTTTLPNAFAIEQEAGPQLRVDVIGRDSVRANQLTAYDLVIENGGNTDALDVPLWITGIPSSATLQLNFALTPAPQGPGEPDWSQAPQTFTSPGGRYLAVVIPRVPPGVLVRRVSISSPVGFQLGAAVTPPWIRGVQFLACLSGGGVIQPGACVGAQLNAINAYLAGAPGIEALSGIGVWSKIAWECEGAASLQAAVAKAEQILDLMVGPLEGGAAPAGCGDVLPARWRSVLDIRVVNAIDPNDKFGPTGSISGRQSIPYSIRFENQENAGAAAQRAVISDPLDVNRLDLNTVRLQTIQFGSTYLDAAGLKSYSNLVDLRPARPLKVQVSAGVDPFTGVLSWYFSTLDTTGRPLPPESLDGFLPPNDPQHDGEGSVLFTVMPRSDLASGSTVHNQASIRFDDDSVQSTPPWANTVDNTPPVSQIQPLAATQDSVNFTVRWGPIDSPDLRDYTIYVSEDNGPLRAWRLNTTSSADTFASRGAHQYVFSSSSRDQSGNIEATHGSYGAQTLGPAAVTEGEAWSLALERVLPNPARGAIHVWFTLPSKAPATLELFDVAGRRMQRRDVGLLGPGRHVLELPGTARLRPALYFLRLAQGAREINARVAVVR